MKQFMVWYSRGLPGAGRFRHQVGAAGELADLERLAEDFFEQMTALAPEADQPALAAGAS